MHIAGEKKEECQKYCMSSYSCQMRRQNGLRKTSESLVLMKLLVQLEENKTSSDIPEIKFASSCISLTHTIYPCITDFGVIFISSKHIPSLNFHLTLFMF